MSRFNTKDQTNKKFSAITTTSDRMITAEGGQGFSRGPQSDLFLMAVSFMGGDANFYESSDQRYERLCDATRYVAVWHPEWLTEMIRWVRNSAMMRTVAGVMAVEAVMARLKAMQAGKTIAYMKKPGVNADLIDAACARADEPGEILAYYLSRYAKPIPNPIEKGLEKAVQRLYTERGFLRYGGTSTKSITMQDVLRLSHAKPADEHQNNLFSYITNPGQGAEDLGLEKIAARNSLMAMPQEKRAEYLRIPTRISGPVIKNAEMGWEHISSWLGSMDKEAWEAVIPNMGVMAMLRNLRNFDNVDISDAHVRMVTDTISNVDEVKQSRILPMRVLSAYRATQNLRWSYPLEQCLNACLNNVPEIPGKTLVLIDMSGSMTWSSLGGRTNLSYADAAKIFGSVMAARNKGVELIQYGSYHDPIKFRRGTSVLKIMEKFTNMGGTRTAQTLRETYAGHDRVIIVTDEQAHYSGFGAVGDQLPQGVPLYTWNLAGYSSSHAPFGQDNRFIFGGGFSDAAFGMIKYIEEGRKAAWPWETS